MTQYTIPDLLPDHILQAYSYQYMDDIEKQIFVEHQVSRWYLGVTGRYIGLIEGRKNE